ncbi:MAG: metallophosphoesterase family protein [Actinobacteria bacterium]|nr:metallophosphoesterase family protein [Actinomycetota bacterium]
MNTSDKWKRSAGKVHIGVLSDTHGLLMPDVLHHFARVDHIIHAGDVGGVQVLTALSAVAPVTAVAGNMDMGELFDQLPHEASGEVCGIRFLVAHTQRDIMARHQDPAREGYDLVVTGHTHHASADWHDGVLYLNPGSAGPRRFGSQASIALVAVDSVGLDPRIITLS